MSSRSSEHRRDKKNKMLKPNVASDGGVSSGGDDGGGGGAEDGAGIDQSLLEKRLEGLRDTQESVQGLSLWCQANKRHSSAIIETWLKILRKSPVEKRLTLFYLANDVVQHARRKNDLTVVNQWAFAVQKATPLVRTPSSVSTAIARIFRIWEERNVYSKDTIADLLALLNNVPAKERAGEKKKPETYTASQEKVTAFQPSALISKIKLAYRLKSHLGVTFRAKPFVHMDMETLKASIKDRSHGMEVIQEIGQLVEQLKASEAKLQSEVEERRKIVETAEVAIVFYENVRGEAKIVNSAYKNFTQRVLTTKEKVEEKIRAFDEMERDISPVPSPPPNAPSPPPDEDEFGVRPADSTDPLFDWSQSQSQHQTHNNSSVIPTESIRNDIMDALKTVIPSSTPSSSNMSSSYQQSHTTTTSSSNSAMNHPRQIPTTNTTQPSTSGMTPYDPTMGGSMPSLAAVQQQFQQSWGGNAADNYAAMSAMSNMIQQMLPGANNYLQMQQTLQATGYSSTGSSGQTSGYETYDPQHGHHQHGSSSMPGVDISSIPLPPVPNSDPPLPPPPAPGHDSLTPQTQQMNSHNIYTQQSLLDLNSSAIDNNEYIPYQPQSLHQHDSHQSHGNHGNSNMHSSSTYAEYEPSHQQQMQYTPTPTGPSFNQNNNRYHPYNTNSINTSGRHRRTSDASSTGNSLPDRPPSLIGSPPGSAGYSNNNSQGESSRFLNNNTAIPPHSNSSGDGPASTSFDPMEMFQSALTKTRSTESGKPLSESPRHSDGSIQSRSMSIDSSPPTPSYGGPQSQNPFYTGGSGMYDSFDNTPSTPTGGMNGSEAPDYVEPYTPRKPAMNMNYTPRGRGISRGMDSGTARGMFNNNNSAPRGMRPSRGGSPRGFRGRGTPRGPPRGGRAFIHF